ncbi:hypothetical protein JKA74_20115 [Marivirga sp. S37H4]|uniref:DUF6036 domain-containing protein n=1 Tax=Marivirga aurantiaca TaxID=2802615 RepID=A0A934X1T5_9BACT|nr:DUF6036 family nucleotidyltransferase [Marivirga aurantiaca]MBK6267359.1 hypothetical protein [Marivirga aurantiaca]
MAVKTNIDNLKQFTGLTRFASKIYRANKRNEPKDFMDIHSEEVLGLLKSLFENKVEYILVGGVATVFHGHIRTTGDIDLWVKEEPENKKRLVKALVQVDVPAAESYFKVPLIPGWSSLTIGDSGFTADFMGYTSLFKKEDFEEVYQRSYQSEIEGIPIRVIHINDLILEKKNLGRHKDLDDVENLEKIRDQNNMKS